MTFLKSFTAVTFATVFFSLTSCTSNEKSNTTTEPGTDTTTAATTSTEPAATSTIVTTPQNMLVAQHKVANYAKWKMSYDDHDSMRLANGIHSYVIGRGVQDSNMVLVAVKVDDTAKARAFSKDPDLKKAMQKGGVMGTPVMNLTTMVYQDTATIGTNLRSSTTFTVKDWDTWLKNFEEGKQARDENGIVVRAYGHDVADNHKVRVVTALLDSAKAVAYFKSDALKKRMEAAGVVGQPNRFIFRVVQRY